MKTWKMCQQLYNALVTEHTDAQHLHERRYSDEKIENALDYFRHQLPYGVYPAKSYAIAIVYATLLEEVYGEDFFEVLNDPELLYGQDTHFVPYSKDPETYDAIIVRLTDMPDWIKSGWAPFTVQYFHAECTEAGLEAVNNNL